MDKGGEGEKPKVVVDASVAVKWVIPGEPWEEQAVALKDMVVSGEVEAYAPQLIMYEVASVILKAVLRGILKPSRGAEALRAFKDLGISIQAFDWDCAAEVLAAALETGLTIYGSVYLHLSRRLNCRLVTADRELEEKGEKLCRDHPSRGPKPPAVNGTLPVVLLLCCWEFVGCCRADMLG